MPAWPVRKFALAVQAMLTEDSLIRKMVPSAWSCATRIACKTIVVAIAAEIRSQAPNAKISIRARHPWPRGSRHQAIAEPWPTLPGAFIRRKGPSV